MSVLSPSRQNQHIWLNDRAGGLVMVDRAGAYARPTTMLTRAARALVLPRLGNVTGGGVQIVDADGAHAVGAANGDSLEHDLAEAAMHSLVVVDPRFYTCVARHGSLGAGDAYVRGYWHSDDLVELLRFFARNLSQLSDIERPWTRGLKLARRLLSNLRPNTRGVSRQNIVAHYDLSNEFFALFLDPTMTYSSGVFEHESATLEQASLAKYERLAQHLQLRESDRVVEIGCGWGGFAEYAASRYGCHVTGVTISPAQFDYARRRIAAAGLANRVDIQLCDYRDLHGRFDKLASIEMVEAVGHAQLPTFFAKCCQLLRADGLMAMQAITIPDQRYARYRRGVDFIQKYIFPGGHLPSLGAIAAAVGRATDFRIVHQQDLAEHYARTLMAWRRAFLAADDRIAALGFGAEFRRAWDYYFSSCAAGFYERQIGVSHLVLAKPNHRDERL